MNKPIFASKHVLMAAADWDKAPGKHGFRDSTSYDVYIRGKAYPPKAIAAIALRHAGGEALSPSDFPGKEKGKFHRALAAAGYPVVPKGHQRPTSHLPPKDNTIHQFKNVAPFEDCERAFLVTSTQNNRALNLRQLKQRRSGNWQFNADARGCVPGDALFVVLPSADCAGGYPRTLFGGVIDKLEKTKEGLICFHVEAFQKLTAITRDSGIRAFLGGRVTAAGNHVTTVWGTADSARRKAMMAIDEVDSFPEGAEREAFKRHVWRERDPRVIRQAKARAKAMYNALTCEVCSFDFSGTYGDLGDDYIEGHHKKPIGDMAPEGEATMVKDIALVCSNCHRMLHRSRPPLTTKELKERIEKMAPKNAAVSKATTSKATPKPR